MALCQTLESLEEGSAEGSVLWLRMGDYLRVGKRSGQRKGSERGERHMWVFSLLGLLGLFLMELIIGYNFFCRRIELQVNIGTEFFGVAFSAVSASLKVLRYFHFPWRVFRRCLFLSSSVLSRR